MDATFVPTDTGDIRATGLREHLDGRGIKHAWLARQLGFSRSKMHNIVTGVSRVQPDAADQICRLLEAPFFVLFDVTEESADQTAESAA